LKKSDIDSYELVSPFFLTQLQQPGRAPVCPTKISYKLTGPGNGAEKEIKHEKNNS